MPHLLILHKEKDDLESELNAVWSFRGVAEKSSGSVFMRRFAPRFLTAFEMTNVTLHSGSQFEDGIHNLG